MPRTFNGTTQRLDGGFWFDGSEASQLMVVAWYRPSDLSVDAGNDVDTIALRGKQEGVASKYVWSVHQVRSNVGAGPFVQASFSSGSSGQAANYIYSGGVSVGEWICVVAAWDGTNRGIWTSKGAGTNTTTTVGSLLTSSAANYEFRLGGSGNSDRFFPGDIGPVAVYTSLPSWPTDDYVAQFYNAHPLLVRPDATACWDIDGESSPEWDKIGGKTLALVNAPAKATTSPPIILPRTMLSSTFINQYGEIDVRGNGISIVDGSVTTNLADGTDFGDVVV